MSPRFQDEDVDAVRERTDIVEIISEHVRLKRSGRNYMGLCPFHQEKTPSLSVDRDQGLYYCHGCGAGGNVFTFVEEVEALTFPEAVETLAGRYGVQLREVSGGGKRQESPRRRLLALHEAAVERYRENLLEADAEPVREYLEARGIGPEAVERHRIGFGGWTKDGLLRTLVRKGFTAQELNAAGLAVGDRGGARDMFFGRLLFPIFDPSDRAVGFGGRVLPEEHRLPGAPDAPKYINSRETPIFKKSRVLYGANWARGEVVQKRRLVLVEGYTDVIALHASGVGEAVATCGTSLTEDHMKEISTRFGDVRVVLCLDADAAGQQAMSRERTEELAERFSAGGHLQGGAWLPVGRGWLPEVYVANLPDEADPADFVAAEGAEGLERLLGDPTPLVRFVLNRALADEDLATPEGRTRAVRKAAAVLVQVGDPLLRHEYALWVAGVVGVEPYEVTRTVESRTGTDRGRRGREEPPGPDVLSGQHRVEREALRAVINAERLLRDPDLGPEEEDFTLPVHRSLFRLLRSDHDRGESIDPGRLASRVQEPDVRRALGEISTGDPLEEDSAREVLERLKGFSLGRRIEERKTRLRALDPDRERDAYDTLFEELLQLETERRALGRASGG